MKKIQIKNSGINPFLVNPIKATLNGKDITIIHCFSTANGIECSFDYVGGGGSGFVLLEYVEFMNTHEFDRFKSMVKMLSRWVDSKSCLEYGIEIK